MGKNWISNCFYLCICFGFSRDLNQRLLSCESSVDNTRPWLLALIVTSWVNNYCFWLKCTTKLYWIFCLPLFRFVDIKWLFQLNVFVGLSFFSLTIEWTFKQKFSLFFPLFELNIERINIEVELIGFVIFNLGFGQTKLKSFLLNQKQKKCTWRSFWSILLVFYEIWNNWPSFEFHLFILETFFCLLFGSSPILHLSLPASQNFQEKKLMEKLNIA